MTYTAIRVGASATIEDVTFAAGDEAIRIQSGFDITITDCGIFAGGIVFERGYQTAIIANTFIGAFDAITFENDVDTIQVVGNRFQTSGIIQGDDKYIGGLLFSTNLGYGGSLDGLVGDYITITNNRFIGGADINITGAFIQLLIDGNAIEGRIVAHGDPDGLGGRISNNYIEYGSIEVHDFNVMDVTDNTVLFSTGACIIVAGASTGVTVKGNHLDDPGASSPTVVGVDIQDATVVNTWVVLNRFGPGLATAISDSGTNTSTSVSVGSAGDNYDAT